MTSTPLAPTRRGSRPDETARTSIHTLRLRPEDVLSTPPTSVGDSQFVAELRSTHLGSPSYAVGDRGTLAPEFIALQYSEEGYERVWRLAYQRLGEQLMYTLVSDGSSSGYITATTSRPSEG